MKNEQAAVLLTYLQAFLSKPDVENAGEFEASDAFDQKRIAALPELRGLLNDFITGKIDFERFREEHELKCRKFPYWGFGGFSGQMQLNQYANSVEGEDKDEVFRRSVKVPATEEEAKIKINKLTKYIADKRAMLSSEKRRSLPRPASVKYVLTYFWEIQDHTKWPVFYNSNRQVLDAVGVLKAGESEGDSYLDYLRVLREIWSLFEGVVRGRDIKYPFWLVEHVLWKPFLSSNTSTGAPVAGKKEKSKQPAQEIKSPEKDVASEIVTEWVPPIIADLNELAFNRETAWSKRNSLKPEKALERKLSYVFTLLGYETTELGQGTGRQPDGLAISVGVPDGDYALIYDAKAREKNFSVGTGDREILEYIKRKDAELRKVRVNRSSFLIVSSDFDSNHKSLDAIMGVYRLTRIPIIMLKAADLLFLVEEKLKDIEFTHKRLEDLFLETGILTREKIVDALGIR